MLGGPRRKREHPLTLLIRTWCQVISQLRVPAAIHKGFVSSSLVDMLRLVYEICELSFSPSDVRFSCVRRPRLYYVLVLRGAARVQHHTTQ
eukprot:4995494-Lingulodinium_polyedra.AAC.1